jgi:hypothetical protein
MARQALMLNSTSSTDLANRHPALTEPATYARGQKRLDFGLGNAPRGSSHCRRRVMNPSTSAAHTDRPSLFSGTSTHPFSLVHLHSNSQKWQNVLGLQSENCETNHSIYNEKTHNVPSRPTCCASSVELRNCHFRGIAIGMRKSLTQMWYKEVYRPKNARINTAHPCGLCASLKHDEKWPFFPKFYPCTRRVST